MQLHHYFRSSASYRVRIALNLKQLPCDLLAVHLLKNGGEQLSADFRKINPDGLVPVLNDDGNMVNQSLAIIEYLEETHPTPALLPANPLDRAYVRGLALSIACDIHPLANLRVTRYLVNTLKVSEDDKNMWYRHWCEQGLAALEVTLANAPRRGTFCFGETPTLADCCLVPQIYNALRMKCDLSAMPIIMGINAACLALPAFDKARPEAQADAE